MNSVHRQECRYKLGVVILKIVTKEQKLQINLTITTTF